MANVGNADEGMVLIGQGRTVGPTFASIGTGSGLNANGVVIAQNNSAFTATGNGILGQVLTSQGVGSDPIFLDAPASLFPWTDEAVNKTMAVNSGYTTSGVTRILLTLPATCVYGAIFRVVGNSAAGWRVVQNAGQVIHLGNIDTTVGAAGFIQSSGTYDAVEILCTTADTGFTVISGPQGNITYN